MATETNSEGQEPFKMKGFSTSRKMKDFLDALQTWEQKGRFAQALFDFGLDGKEPNCFDPESAENRVAKSAFELARPWLERQRREREAKAKNGAKGGQAGANTPRNFFNANASKAPPQVAPFEDLEDPAFKGRRDAQEGKETEEAKAWLSNTAENAAFSTRLQFAESLGIPKDLLTFTGKDFEKLEDKLQDVGLTQEALLRARIGNFSRFSEWAKAKQEALKSGKPKNLLPLLANIFKGIEEGFGNKEEPREASSQDPARPPQNSTQADKEGARNLPSENTAPKETDPKRQAVFEASSIRRKFAKAFDVAESGLEFSAKEFEEVKEKLEEPNALRGLLRQAQADKERDAGQAMRKKLFRGGKLFLKFYLLAAWKLEADLAQTKDPEKRIALLTDRKRFLVKNPPRKAK